MPEFIDLLIDETTGDLDITGGDFDLTNSSGLSLRQRIEARFSTWKEEWPYNTAFGTPYRQRLFVAGTTKEQADAEFIAQINLEPDVTAIKNVISTYEPTTRSYVLQRVEVYVDNVLLDLSIASPESTKFSYPIPQEIDSDFNVCELDQGFIDQSNALYELLNIELPQTGSSTWWNLWSTNTP